MNFSKLVNGKRKKFVKNPSVKMQGRVYFLKKPLTSFSKHAPNISFSSFFGSVYGIGRALSDSLCVFIGVNPACTLALYRDHLQMVLNRAERFIAARAFEIEGSLRKYSAASRERLSKQGFSRGVRYLQGLPVRGQRTKTNAKTRKRK